VALDATKELNAGVPKACRRRACVSDTQALLRELDEAAVGVAHVGGSAPREVARAVDRHARRRQGGGKIVETFDGEGDVVLGGRIAGDGLDGEVDPEHELAELEDRVLLRLLGGSDSEGALVEGGDSGDV